MRKGSSYFVIAAVTVPLALYGCANTGELKQSESFSIQGCVAGGLGAGALAYLKYRDDPDRDEKIAIVTAIGCFGGAMVGYKVGKRTEEYADAQQAAQAEIARNKKHTEELRQVNSRLQENIDEYNKQIQKIENSTFTAREKQEQKHDIKKYVSGQLNKAKASLGEVETELAAANREFQSFQATASQADREAWRVELASLEQEKDILSGHVSTLNALDSSI